MAALAAGLGAASPAQASDASLRKVIRAQEKKVDAVAKDFADASEDVESAVGRERAGIAVTELKRAVKRLRTAVVKEQATTARVKRGRTQYLRFVTSFSAGLRTFDRALEAFDPEAPAAAEPLFRRAAAQIKAAGVRRDRAAKLIGGLAS